MYKQNFSENRLIGNTLFTFFVSGASCMLMGNLMPYLREVYGISYARAGFLLSLPSWGNLASIFITGYLPAVVGRRKTILTTSIWMALAYICVCLGIGGAVLLPVICVMIGVSRGGNSNFSNTMISTLPGKKAAVGYNLLHGAFAVGAVVSPLMLVFCVNHFTDGWRLMTGVISVLCALQVLTYATMPLPAENITGSIRSVDRSFLRHRSFWFASCILFFYISAEYAIANWLVTYFRDSGILSPDISQMMSSLLWVVMFVGRLLGAWLVGRISRKLLLVADGVGLLIFFAVVFFSRSQAPIFIGVMGVGLFMATIYTSALALGTECVRGNDLGVSSMILIGSAGGILTPALVGMVAEQAGIQAGMGVVVAVTVFLLAAILFSVFTKGAET